MRRNDSAGAKTRPRRERTPSRRATRADAHGAMKDGDDATRKSRHLRDERDAKLYGKMRELMTSDRGAPGAKAKVRNALKRVDSEFDQRGPDIALERQDAEVMGLCRDVVSKEAWKRWSANACEDAVKNDSIERLKFLHECGVPLA